MSGNHSYVPVTAPDYRRLARKRLPRFLFDYIDGDDIMWEHEPLRRLAAEGQLMAFKHTSFWQCMDTLREKHMLEELWMSGEAPWKTWED
mgnify:CR=1 FL=1